MFSENLIEDLAYDVVFEGDDFDDPWQCEVKQVFDCFTRICEFGIDSDGHVFARSPTDGLECLYVGSRELNNSINFLARIFGMDLERFQLGIINQMLEFHVYTVESIEDDPETDVVDG